jgi:hypothetical protein
MATWRELIGKEMTVRGEMWDDVLGCTLSEEELGTEFDGDYGCSEGKPFTLWTSRRVYFPAVYDGSEWVASVPRDPCSEAVSHVGGV